MAVFQTVVRVLPACAQGVHGARAGIVYIYAHTGITNIYMYVLQYAHTYIYIHIASVSWYSPHINSNTPTCSNMCVRRERNKSCNIMCHVKPPAPPTSMLYAICPLPRCKKKAVRSTFGKRLPQPNFDEGVKGVYVKTWYSCTAFLFARVGRGI